MSGAISRSGVHPAPVIIILMDEAKLDAESITRNKNYTAQDHLVHLLKVGWAPDSPVVKKFLQNNLMPESALQDALKRLSEIG